MEIESQNKRIKQHLIDGYSITPIQALKLFGCFRLSARIHELRKEMDIKAEKVINNGKSFCSYYLKR